MAPLVDDKELSGEFGSWMMVVVLSADDAGAGELGETRLS
jgi:hypothetical protein